MKPLNAIELWPAVVELKQRVLDHWAKGHTGVAIQAGMRGGKTQMARALIREDSQRHFVVVAASWTIANLAYGDLPGKTLHSYTPNDFDAFALVNESWFNLNTIILFEDGFWLNNSEEMFDDALEVSDRVLLISSAYRPHTLLEHWLAFRRKLPRRWKNRERIWRYATWDLNPNVSRAALEDKFRENRRRAERDFGNPEP